MKLGKIGTLALLFVPGVWAQSIAGLWDGTLNLNGTDIPFKIGFSGGGSEVKGWFFNGDDKEVSNAGNFENGSLTLNFDSYASVLTLTLKDGALDGEYVQRGKGLPIHAVRAAEHPTASEVKAPDIAGVWVLEGVKSSKNTISKLPLPMEVNATRNPTSAPIAISFSRALAVGASTQTRGGLSFFSRTRGRRNPTQNSVAPSPRRRR